MANINVSIDAKGTLKCDDISGYIGESITWVPDATSIASIVSIVPTIGSFNPAPSGKNNWTGIIATDGVMPNSLDGVEYTIVVNARNGAFGQKQKSPKITMLAPMVEKNH